MMEIIISIILCFGDLSFAIFFKIKEKPSSQRFLYFPKPGFIMVPCHTITGLPPARLDYPLAKESSQGFNVASTPEANTLCFVPYNQEKNSLLVSILYS